ncbi:MAG TPA: ABC transporter permease [Magnetospirillaceae bacterium]|jgi:sulfonate transport system permease protein
MPESQLASAPTELGPKRSRARFGWLLGLILPVIVVIGWEILATQHLINDRLMPAPSKVWVTLVKLAQSGELIKHIIATLRRVALGFGFGVVAATVFGALTGYSHIARRLLDPSLQALRAIPSIAWVPLFILWFGIFETSKVILIAVGVFFPIYLALSDAIPAVDRKLVEVARVYRFSPAEMTARVLLPATLPAYFTALRSGLGLGWMFVVAAELMGASEGLGYLLVDGQETGNPTQIIAAIVVFAIVGKLTDWGLALLSARLLVWQDSFKPAG